MIEGTGTAYETVIMQAAEEIESEVEARTDTGRRKIGLRHRGTWQYSTI
jgi:hypothetical protein